MAKLMAKIMRQPIEKVCSFKKKRSEIKNISFKNIIYYYIIFIYHRNMGVPHWNP